jgi:hypothetical protein
MTQIEKAKTPEQQTANYLFQQAKVLSNTEIVPAHLRGKPEHIYAIILTGHEIGISPTNALQSFASINGKLTMSAELMRALILGAGHSLSFPESTTETCTITGKRKDTGDTATVTYTKEDAERAGLWNTHTWKKYPRQLLSARCTTEIARLLFPDLIKGVSYTPEELGSVWSEDDDNKITFEVENAAIEGEPIVDVELEIFEEVFEPEPQIEVEVDPITGANVDDEKPISAAQVKMLVTVTGQLPKELQTIEEKARELKYNGRSRKTFTKKELDEHLSYIEHLKGTVA